MDKHARVESWLSTRFKFRAAPRPNWARRSAGVDAPRGEADEFQRTV